MDSILMQQKIEQLLTQSSEYDNLKVTDPDYMLYSPGSVGYNTISEQNYLFQNLLVGFNPVSDNITDIGCGRADLCNFIQEFYGTPAPYYGIDHNPIMADLAKQKYGYKISIGAFEKVLPTLDNTSWVVASGVFTQRRCETEDADLIKLFEDIDLMYISAKQVVSFNLLSPIGNKIVPTFFYVHPGLILDMLIEKYKFVSLRHNYSKDIYTVTIYKYDKI
jgi:SAM-dependent methyltransferase